MPNKYIIKYTENRCIEISKPNSSMLAYKIPYEEIKKPILDIEIANRFIVYILVGKNSHGENIIYVGKSKNGIDRRPTAHESCDKNWEYCYVLTTFNEKTFFNDGTIQYIENKIYEKLSENDEFINTTQVTNINTINPSDAEDCDLYIEEVQHMIYVLGLNLMGKTKNTEHIQKTTNDDITSICTNILSSI